MAMRDESNLGIYRRWAPFYDAVVGSLYSRGRHRAIEALDLRPGETVFVPGIGTGLDIPAIPAGVAITGLDLSPDMLGKARERAAARDDVTLVHGDAQSVPLPDASFDAVLCDLVLSVVPDARTTFAEAWRVLRPGGRLAIFDKFVPEGGRVSGLRRVVGRIAEAVGTDPNRRLPDIIGGVPGLVVLSDEPDLLGGQYRVVLMKKSSHPADEPREETG